MTTDSEWKENRLLASLPPDTQQAWMEHLKRVELCTGDVLEEAGTRRMHVYFPASAVVSLLHVMQDGSTAQIAVVGREGVVGVALFMGGRSTPGRAVVHHPGIAYRLHAEVLLREFERGGAVMGVLLRYAQCLITQVTQTAICNRHHTILQQLSRLLLLSLDATTGDELVLTQEFIAQLLGVRREGITAAAARLQRLGVIRYARGHITVLDRQVLERISCECYSVVGQECRRLLPPLPP